MTPITVSPLEWHILFLSQTVHPHTCNKEVQRFCRHKTDCLTSLWTIETTNKTKGTDICTSENNPDTMLKTERNCEIRLLPNKLITSYHHDGGECPSRAQVYEHERWSSITYKKVSGVPNLWRCGSYRIRSEQQIVNTRWFFLERDCWRKALYLWQCYRLVSKCDADTSTYTYLILLITSIYTGT